ncbi:NACHT domain-containing NTPase [Nostoc sp. FACHB-110]|uniref:NACHT domain-containing protein n=1 Tax=Nostoc sp. FACHB-110 TaxID=2692834 RepID=UPI001687E70C|nr:NACHT domain-containing NTPase [Nostoc sp. FACHB-110]MBD2436181.1 NACHT domain-containing NTPase [Nostoc sp. FACHB-110]
MARRSLQASAEGIRKAKQAFKRKGWTQEYLAAEVGLETRQTIWKFFTGKPIDRHVFNDICFVLELDSAEIIQPVAGDEATLLNLSLDIPIDIETLVHKLRSVHQENIQAQCGTVQLLDIPRPINFNDIYIDVDILEEINSQKWLDIHKLPNLLIEENHHFSFTDLTQTRVSGLEALSKYSKLMVFGKPGSGKTTLLQAIANSCNQGIYLADYLPIYIRLQNFAEDIQGRKKTSFCQYLQEYFSNLGIHAQEIATVLAHGKALILLDGWDEIAEEDCELIFHKLRQFTEKYYKNSLVITSRLGSQNYKFSGFTEVEIADFSKLQITKFAEKWFYNNTKNSATATDLVSRFMQKLELPANGEILDLATTPLLLSFLCLVFLFNGDFPDHRTEFYKQAIDLMLMRWDEARGMKRDKFPCNLTLLHKIKLLCYIAAHSFAQGNYFLSEAKLRQLITNYLRQIIHEPVDLEALELETTSILKAFEIQHGLLVKRARGIYSFSHLSFQKYFTAREVVTSLNTQPMPEFMNHISEKHWQTVFLISAGMLNPADDLLVAIQQKINTLATTNSKLWDFLIWLEKKAAAASTFYHPASLRAFYFTLALPSEHSLACKQDLAILLDSQFAGNLSADLALDLALIHGLTVSLGINGDIFLPRFSALSLALDLKHLLTNEPYLQASLQNLKNQLPSPSQGRDTLKVWWQTNGKFWTEALRTLMIETRQIGHDWQFTPQDLHDIQQYWDANKLLLDCLKSSAEISPDLRINLKKTLFLIENVDRKYV